MLKKQTKDFVDAYFSRTSNEIAIDYYDLAAANSLLADDATPPAYEDFDISQAVLRASFDLRHDLKLDQALENRVGLVRSHGPSVASFAINHGGEFPAVGVSIKIKAITANDWNGSLSDSRMSARKPLKVPHVINRSPKAPLVQ